MPAKPAKKRQYKRRDPSTLKQTSSIAMFAWQWDKLDLLRGKKARGVFIAQALDLPEQPTK